MLSSSSPGLSVVAFNTVVRNDVTRVVFNSVIGFWLCVVKCSNFSVELTYLDVVFKRLGYNVVNSGVAFEI